MLELVKAYVLNVWELRKARLYGNDPNVQQSQSPTASGEDLSSSECCVFEYVWCMVNGLSATTAP